MVRLSVGMREQVPTRDLTSVQDPFKDTNRLILPPLILPPLILLIINDDEDADEGEYISLLTKTRIRNDMRKRAIKILSKLNPNGYMSFAQKPA